MAATLRLNQLLLGTTALLVCLAYNHGVVASDIRNNALCGTGGEGAPSCRIEVEERLARPRDAVGPPSAEPTKLQLEARADQASSSKKKAPKPSPSSSKAKKPADPPPKTKDPAPTPAPPAPKKPSKPPAASTPSKTPTPAPKPSPPPPPTPPGKAAAGCPAELCVPCEDKKNPEPPSASDADETVAARKARRWFEPASRHGRGGGGLDDHGSRFSPLRRGLLLLDPAATAANGMKKFEVCRNTYFSGPYPMANDGNQFAAYGYTYEAKVSAEPKDPGCQWDFKSIKSRPGAKPDDTAGKTYESEFMSAVFRSGDLKSTVSSTNLLLPGKLSTSMSRSWSDSSPSSSIRKKGAAAAGRRTRWSSSWPRRAASRDNATGSRAAPRWPR